LGREILQKKSKRIAKSEPTTDLAKTEGIAGTKDRTLNSRLISQALSTLWVPPGATKEVQLEHMGAAMLLLEGIKPEGEIEGMLAAQMIGTHHAAMDCLRRAMLPEQTFEGREQNLKHAARLLSIFPAQLDALNKNRGKGQQKVTVEHLYVGPGANAVVGNVQASPHPETDSTKSPPALAYKPAQTLDLDTSRRVHIKQRK
jgi:hypothetical protein